MIDTVPRMVVTVFLSDLFQAQIAKVKACFKAK